MDAVIHLTERSVRGEKVNGTSEVKVNHFSPGKSGEFFSLRMKFKEAGEDGTSEVSVFFENLDELAKFRSQVDEAVMNAIFGKD